MSSMPSSMDARMTLLISSSRFSSMSLRMVGLANMISTAGTREMPGLTQGSSFWQTMACRLKTSVWRTRSREPSGIRSRIRLIVCELLDACTVPNTR